MYDVAVQHETRPAKSTRSERRCGPFIRSTASSDEGAVEVSVASVAFRVAVAVDRCGVEAHVAPGALVHPAARRPPPEASEPTNSTESRCDDPHEFGVVTGTIAFIIRATVHFARTAIHAVKSPTANPQNATVRAEYQPDFGPGVLRLEG